MKKLFVTILAFLYLGTTIGATVHRHFCMDKLVEWGLWHNNKSQIKKCATCGMEKNAKDDEGCCKDEYKQVKLQSDHKAADNFLLQLNSTAIALTYFELPSLNLLSPSQEYPISHAPPRYEGVATYIRNCIFLI